MKDRPRTTPFRKAVLALTGKDLREELRGRELISIMLLFSIIVVLIFSFALELDREARETSVVGIFWATVVFAGMLGLNRSLAAEKDRGNLDALLLAPIHRGALFFGKMLSNLIFMILISALLMFLIGILFNISLFNLGFTGVMLLGTLGFATVGTLTSSMAVHTRSREALLPVLMLPISMPIIISAVRASTGIVTGAPEILWIAWPQLLIATDAIMLALAYVLFDFVVEE